jgi:hypothetical protein
MTKQLTDMQQKFLDVLFEEAKGDVVRAKKLAGYSDNVGTTQVVNALEDEIADLTKKFIARSATKAAYSLSEVLDDPTALGNKERMVAAKDLLDRGGFVKTEKVEVKSDNPLFILPAKNDD